MFGDYNQQDRHGLHRHGVYNLVGRGNAKICNTDNFQTLEIVTVIAVTELNSSLRKVISELRFHEKSGTQRTRRRALQQRKQSS